MRTRPAATLTSPMRDTGLPPASNGRVTTSTPPTLNTPALRDVRETTMPQSLSWSMSTTTTRSRDRDDAPSSGRSHPSAATTIRGDPGPSPCTTIRHGTDRRARSDRASRTGRTSRMEGWTRRRPRFPRTRHGASRPPLPLHRRRTSRGANRRAPRAHESLLSSASPPDPIEPGPDRRRTVTAASRSRSSSMSCRLAARLPRASRRRSWSARWVQT